MDKVLNLIASHLMRIFFYSVCLLVLSPLFALVLQSFTHESDVFTFLVTNTLDDVIFNTLALSVLVGLGVLLIGVSCAWLTVHYIFPGSKIIQWALFMPLAFPAYILAYVYTDFFDAAGTFGNTLREQGLEWLLPDMRTISGAAFILIFCLYPYVYIFARNGFLNGSRNQMESGKLLGSSVFLQFLDIALPAARPFILVGVMLVIMEVLADYGTMDYFGIRVFSTVIYDAWAGYGDITAATRLSILLLSVVLLLVWSEQSQRKKMRFYSLSSADNKYAAQCKGNLSMTFWCLMPICVGFVFPASVLLAMVFDTFSMQNVIRTLPYLQNTLSICAVVAVIGVSLSYILAAQKRSQKLKFTDFFYSLCGFGYALPGVILGLGFLLVSSFFSAMNILITGTYIFLVIGYLVRFLNVALQGTQAGYDKISPSLDQASQLMQNSKFVDFWQVKLPLLAPSLMSAGLILAIEVIKELPLTLILRPFDFDTLAVYTYNLASDERLSDAAFPALCIVLAGCIPIALMQKLARRTF